MCQSGLAGRVIGPAGVSMVMSDSCSRASWRRMVWCVRCLGCRVRANSPVCFFWCSRSAFVTTPSLPVSLKAVVSALIAHLW